MRADVATGLDWMSVRAYDPTIGRFISRDPLGRAPLVFADNPYVYAGNNPLSNVDPSGQYRAAGFGSTQRESGQATNQQMAHIVTQSGCDKACQAQRQQEARLAHARSIASAAAAYFGAQTKSLPGSVLHWFIPVLGPGLILGLFGTGTATVPTLLKMLGQAMGNYTDASGNGFLGVVGRLASFMYIGMLADFVLYDMVAEACQGLFQNEVAASDAFWLSPDGADQYYAAIVGISMVVSFVTIAIAGVEAVFMSEVAPFWAATAVATVALIMTNLQHYAETYTDQEEAVFGYGLS